MSEDIVDGSIMAPMDTANNFGDEQEKPALISQVGNFLIENRDKDVGGLVSGLRELLGDNYINLISQHNTPCQIVVFGNENEGKYVAKLERNDNPATTRKEVLWNDYIQENGAVAEHFPKYYGGHQDENLAFYFLEYLEGFTPVGQLFLDGKMTIEELVKVSTDSITAVEKMFDSLPKKKDPGVVREAFAGRLQKRIDEMYKFDYLKEMLGKEEIVINGKPYKNIPHYMERLVNSPLLDEMAESDLGIIHGDMHLGNILLNEEKNEFKFLDPNGAQFLPLEYDYSKILYATHTGYDFLHVGRYQLSGGDGVYEFKLDEEEKRRAVTEGYVKFLGDKAKTVHYTNIVHTLASLPHHANDVQEETATYLQSLILLDELYGEQETKAT